MTVLRAINPRGAGNSGGRHPGENKATQPDFQPSTPGCGAPERSCRGPAREGGYSGNPWCTLACQDCPEDADRRRCGTGSQRRIPCCCSRRAVRGSQGAIARRLSRRRRRSAGARGALSPAGSSAFTAGLPWLPVPARCCLARLGRPSRGVRPAPHPGPCAGSPIPPCCEGGFPPQDAGPSPGRFPGAGRCRRPRPWRRRAPARWRYFTWPRLSGFRANPDRK